MRAAAAILILWATSAAGAEDFVLENQVVRWTITSAGQSKSLVEKPSGRQWAQPGPLALVKKAGQWHAASAVMRRGDAWRVHFGPAGVTAECGIAVRPRYFVVSLVAVEGQGIEELCFARLDAAIAGRYGGWLNVKWNEDFAVAVLGLSDRVNTAGPPGWTMAEPEFGMAGCRAAIVAVPKTQLMEAIQDVERDEKLPSPQIAGRWAKTSPEVRRGYLFTDLTEANADETIRYAKLGAFGCVMTCDSTWSTSLGSYPINTRNFPKGEESLKAAVEKCHAAGLKVGLHMLTSFVGKNDPLVSPKPDGRLLMDGRTALAAGVDATAVELRAAGPLADFPREGAFYGDARQGMDLLVDQEIIHYANIGGPGGRTFLGCSRGFAHTTPAAHKAGAAIHHICERYGSYLVDLRTSLKDELAQRVAGVFNRCGFDMIYFDGGECNMANGPFWYWVSQQQMAIYSRMRRDVLVQGSGGTPWTWHIFARGCCDDFAAVAPKQYLDLHKIADSWQAYTDSFMPAELGWWGFLEDTPHNPATSPDEVEYYAVRMLALDTPVSLETNLSALKRNGRTEELLRLLGDYERLRLAGSVPAAVREKLRRGEWHLCRPEEGDSPIFVERKSGQSPVFRPIRYDTQRVAVPGEARAVNTFAAQPLRFRLQAVAKVAAVGDKANQVLLRSDPPAELKLPGAKDAMPGALAGAVDFLKPAGQQAVGMTVGPKAVLGGGGKPVDLLKHRALAVKLRVDGPPPSPGKPVPVLGVQLESWGKTYRDYYVDLDFTGQQTVILPEPSTERMLPEFRPAPQNYEFKAAMYGFNYQGIVALNFRWMRVPAAGGLRCRVELVEALAESDVPLENPAVVLGGRRLAIPAALHPGDYAEYWGEGPLRIFDRNGVTLDTFLVVGRTDRDVVREPQRDKAASLLPGENRLAFESRSPGAAKLTVITLGDQVAP